MNHVAVQVWHWHDKMHLLWILPRSMPSWRHCWRPQLWVLYWNSWGSRHSLFTRPSNCYLTLSLQLLFISVAAGAVVRQGEAPREWWPLGVRNRWESEIWKPLPLRLCLPDCPFLQLPALPLVWKIRSLRCGSWVYIHINIWGWFRWLSCLFFFEKMRLPSQFISSHDSQICHVQWW